MAKARVDGVVANDGAAETESANEAVLPTFAEIYEKLAAPFDKTFQRQIPGGRMLTYITGEQAASRLTEVVGPHWDWDVDEAKVIGDDVIVSGTLSIKTPCREDPTGIYATRSGYGGAKVKKLRSGDVMDLGNDVKAAETSAFKRAASKFGVGLYLYERTEGGENELPSYSGGQSYGQQGSYAPAADRPAVQFGANPTDGSGTTGPIEAVSMPKIDDSGKQRLGGVKVNGAWFNVSNRTPVALGQFQRGQTVTIQHAPGSNFIDGIFAGGGVAQTQTVGQEIEAF